VPGGRVEIVWDERPYYKAEYSHVDKGCDWGGKSAHIRADAEKKKDARSRAGKA